MDLSRLHRSEWLAMLGALVLAISTFLKAYETKPDNANANIDGVKGTLSFFDVHPLLGPLMLLAAIAPFVLAYIIARDHQLSWARGEMTAVVAIAAFGLLVYSGLIDRPGEPSGQIELEFGWYGMLLGILLMLAGSVQRSNTSERRRKPPGVL